MKNLVYYATKIGQGIGWVFKGMCEAIAYGLGLAILFWLFELELTIKYVGG